MRSDPSSSSPSEVDPLRLSIRPITAFTANAASTMVMMSDPKPPPPPP